MVIFFPVWALQAQVNQVNQDNLRSAIVPFTLLLERAKYAGVEYGPWLPDWPLELPPDAFKVKTGGISRCLLEGDGLSMEYRFDEEGRLEEFPFVLNGVITQIGLGYNEFSDIIEVTLSYPASYSSNEDTWYFEILERVDFFPCLVRAFLYDAWYFIYLSGSVYETLESWYNVDGNFMGAYTYSYAETGRYIRMRSFRAYSNQDRTDYSYDSRGFITDIAYNTDLNPGQYKALYFHDDKIRYWERRPVTSNGAMPGMFGNFSFQWDQEDFLVRVTGELVQGQVDNRYVYTLNERGDWIERRETRMYRQYNLLAPSQGSVFRRELEYRE